MVGKGVKEEEKTMQSRRGKETAYQSPLVSVVAKYPGCSALTWIRWGAQSSAAALVSPMTRCLLLTYAAISH